jgi:hypothetical protein
VSFASTSIAFAPESSTTVAVYEKVTLPVSPGGGSKSNVPAAALTFEIVPPAGVVGGPTEATENVGVHPLIAESASVTPVRRPPRPVIFMFVCAL